MRFSFALPGLALAFAISCSSCGGSDDPPPTPTPIPERPFSGSVTLKQEVKNVSTSGLSKYSVGSPCVAESSGYSDVAAGMEILAVAGTETVGVGRLGTGTVVGRSNTGTTVSFSCSFRFSITLPLDRDFLTIKTGRRGEFTYSKAELASLGTLDYTIGN